MSYHYSTEQKGQDISTPVVFQTGLVKLWFSGAIQHGVGGWPAYVNPTEMLPVEHRFGFAGGHPLTELNFTPLAGQVTQKTVVYLRVRESNGTTGVPGATFVWQIHGQPPDQDVPGST